MILKLAREDIGDEPRDIELNSMIDEFKRSGGNKFFYLDKDNLHKDIMNAIDAIKKEGFAVFYREIRYGLDEHDYMYEMHAL
jgi:hypothetical protein